MAGRETIDTVPEGTLCSVEEEGVRNLPDGATVRYVPATASTTGVTIGEGPVFVVAVNDYSRIPLQTGSVEITKAVRATGGAPAPGAFTWGIACKDVNGDFTGTIAGNPTPQLVTVPGDGATVVVDNVTAGSQCAVAEDTSSGQRTASYTVAGQQPTTTYPIFPVAGGSTVEVTVTNTVTGAPPVTGRAGR